MDADLSHHVSLSNFAVFGTQLPFQGTAESSQYTVEGDKEGGANPGVMGAGSVREVEEEKAADGIPKGVGVERNRK